MVNYLSFLLVRKPKYQMAIPSETIKTEPPPQMIMCRPFPHLMVHCIKLYIMVSQRIKTTLSITISPQLYQQLKEEIGSRKISEFVEKAIAKELGEHDNKLEREQKEFVKKLIAGYKRSSRSKSLKKESKI